MGTLQLGFDAVVIDEDCQGWLVAAGGVSDEGRRGLWWARRFEVVGLSSGEGIVAVGRGGGFR